MAKTNLERQHTFRQRAIAKLPDGPAKILARVKEVLKSAPKSYQERLTKVLNKFDDERKTTT